MVGLMNPQPSVIWRVLKRASDAADRLSDLRPFDHIKEDLGRLKAQAPEIPFISLSSSLGTYSAIALMTITVAISGVGGATDPDGSAAATAALKPTPVVERMVSHFAGTDPDGLYASIAGLEPTPNNPPSSELREATSRSSERPAAPANATEFQAEFIMSAVGPAQASQRETGVPASVTIAQAALESDWGRSALSVKGQNYFGIKALSGPGPAGVINMNTGEHLNGQDVTVNAGFRAYHNMEESFSDHGRFLKENDRYSKCFETSDPKEFARRLHAAGYATDPQYAAKLIKFMDKHNLYVYDVR